VQRNALRRKSGALRGDELAQRADVETDGTPRQVPYEFDRREGLGRVGDADIVRARVRLECVERRVDDVEV